MRRDKKTGRFISAKKSVKKPVKHSEKNEPPHKHKRGGSQKGVKWYKRKSTDGSPGGYL